LLCQEYPKKAFKCQLAQYESWFLLQKVLKKKGIEVLHLNIGQPDIKTPVQALDAVRKMDLEVLEYSHSAGLPQYRQALTGYYKNKGISVKPEELLVTTGGSEALMFAFMSCLNPGDEIILPEPFYANYNSFAVTSGVKVIPLKTSINDGFALPAVKEIENLINERTRAILVCNPANPTGYLYSKSELETIRDIVLKYDLYLFADEVYREFIYGDEEHFSVLNMEGIDDNTVLVDSVSKRYSMCGARIGTIISRNKDVIATALKFAQARLSPPTLAQIAAMGALETPESYFTEVIKEYESRRDTLVDGLNSIPGVMCPRPKGAFYVVAEFPVKDTDDFCQWMLSEFSYEGKTVMMAPASGFYSPENNIKNQARLAYVLDVDRLKEAIEIIRLALEKYPQ
jgi:aspartate aminotransferase